MLTLFKFVHFTGLKSVKMLADVYGGGVSKLVSDNVDYLSYHVTLNLRHAHKNPRVLSVLSVIMKHSNMQVLPSLHEIIKDVIIDEEELISYLS
jgi:hypothetical protein